MHNLKIALMVLAIIGLHSIVRYFYLLVYAVIRINKYKKIKEKQKKESGSL